MFDATKNVARKVVDSVTFTYKLNIIDYKYGALEKMSKKWSEIELTNTSLEESNRMLFKSLSDVQEENRRCREEISALKIQCANDAKPVIANVRKTRKIKEEREEIAKTVGKKRSKNSKKLMF